MQPLVIDELEESLEKEIPCESTSDCADSAEYRLAVTPGYYFTENPKKRSFLLCEKCKQATVEWCKNYYGRRWTKALHITKL